MEVMSASLKRSSVRDIFDAQCKKFKETAREVEFGKMRRHLIHIKQEKYPKNPMNFSEIIEVYKNKEIESKFTMSRYEENEKFYIDTIVEEDFAYSLFVSPTISNAIKGRTNLEQRNYIIDGTFNIVPISKQYKQLLIIHIIHADHVRMLKLRNIFT